ncbi:MAG: hypothetical protein IID33_02680 [Planctomycetes bacterium]|nr:hypothetical protein [Planctomycetota bacterium]
MGTESNSTTSPDRKPGRRRRIVLLILSAATAVTALQVYDHYTDPERIRALAEAYLQRYVRGRVTVGSAAFSWVNGVSLFDVSVAEVPAPTSSANADGEAVRSVPVFFCGVVRITHDSLSLLRGDLQIRSIEARGPTCLIARDAVSGRTNLAGLFRPVESIEPLRSITWPTIELTNARVRVMSRERGRQRLVEDLTLTIRALPTTGSHPRYDVVWHTDDARSASGHSRIDLETGEVRNVRGGLPRMSIEAVMLAINAKYDGAGAWYELLGLDGTVRVQDYNLHPGSSAERPPSATIELTDAAISIPINEQERTLAPTQRYLRFEHVNGHVRLTGGEIRAEFSSRFHGSECDAVMTLLGGVDKLGTLDDVHVDAHLTIKGLRLPRPDPDSPAAEVRFIQRWRPLARLYRDYDPSGVVDLDLEVMKPAGKDQPIEVGHLVLTVNGGDASCRFFPYRIDQLEGSVEYTSAGIFVRDLRGRHGKGTVTIDAWVAEPVRGAEKKVTIRGTNIPIDEALTSSLPPRYRKLIEKFELQGTIDVTVELEQPQSDPAMSVKWRKRSTITLRDVFARYAGFPYPIDRLTGTLKIDPTRLEVVDLWGSSGEARIGLHGSASFDARGMTDLDLTVEGQDVAFDDALLAALPAGTREQVEALNPQGRFHLRTTLQLDPETRQVVSRSNVRLDGVSCRPESFPVMVTDLLGRLSITPDEMIFDGVTGRCQDATLSIEGSVSLTETVWSKNLTIKSRNVRLDQSLRAALPRRMREALADWSVDGPIAIDAFVTTDPSDPNRATSIRTIARLSAATVSHPRLPLPLTDVRADITIDQAGVRTSGLDARYGTAKIKVDFDLTHTAQGKSGSITLSAS